MDPSQGPQPHIGAMRRIAFLCLIAAFVATAAAPATAEPSLEQQLDNASTRLSQVTERYNDARLRRASLDGKLARAQELLGRSEAQLAKERERLGVAVRDLYMHPAAGIAQFFQARSYGEIGRKQALGGHVALSADGLILKIRKAQAEARAATASLRRLRDEARRDELAIARERDAAAAAQQRTQQLLRRANVGALEAARQRRLDGAGELAASLIRFPGPVRASAAAAVRAAASQIGKPYQLGRRRAELLRLLRSDDVGVGARRRVPAALVASAVRLPTARVDVPARAGGPRVPREPDPPRRDLQGRGRRDPRAAERTERP